jgi:hypothetical protein
MKKEKPCPLRSMFQGAQCPVVKINCRACEKCDQKNKEGRDCDEKN